MKIYRVGGSVRDRLLGLPVNDHDWLVVGASVDEMLAQGYTPVGRDFPEFLHPQTHDEYALARTERKSAPGYRGFAVQADPSVTLEQDLARRDLTINAIAQAADDPQAPLLDPFGGQRDLEAGVLRHVSAAFAEDPVRILRLARFAARWPHFVVAPETAALTRQMIEAGEADALVAERVWQELAKGLLEPVPSVMFAVLRDCGALARVLPQIDALYDDGRAGEALAALDASAREKYTLEVRFAALLRALEPEAVEVLCARLRAPAACRELAVLAARHAHALADVAELDAEEIMALLEAGDAWRRPERFIALTQAALAGEANSDSAQLRLQRAQNATLAVDAGAVAGKHAAGDIKAAVAQARLDALRAAIR